MKYGLALLIVIFLAGCADVDPYQQIEQAQAQINATQRAGKQQQKETAQAEADETQTALKAIDAAQTELDLAKAEAAATQTSLDIEIRKLDAAELAAKKTQTSWELGLAATQTLQAMQATQTVFPLEATTAYVEQKSAQDRAIAWSGALPVILGAILLGVVALVGVLVWWLICWALVSLSGKKMIQVTIPGRMHAALETEAGTMQFDETAKVHSRDTQKLIDFGEQESQATNAPRGRMSSHDNDPVLTDDVREAIYLLAASMARREEDDAENQVLRHSRIGWGGTRWQNIVDWMKDERLVYTNSTGTYLLDGTCAYVVDELKAGRLPHPTE